MQIVKKSLIALFLYFCGGIFSLPGFATDSHHSFVDNINFSDCDSCCEREKDCLQNCLLTSIVSSNYYKMTAKYYKSIAGGSTASRLLSCTYFCKDFIDKKLLNDHTNFFLISYIGKQKITG